MMRTSLKNAKVTAGLGERQIKVCLFPASLSIPVLFNTSSLPAFCTHLCPSARALGSIPAPFRPGAMLHLLLLSLLLAGVPPGGTSEAWKGDLAREQALEFSTVTLNESCREQILQRARALTCQLLRLDRPPRLTASMTHQVREAWAKEAARSLDPSVGGQHLNIISNQTLLIERAGCLQISQPITLDDLGWVLSPRSFTFTECLGCGCHRKEEETQLRLWSQACGLQPPSHQAQQRRCCRPPKTLLPFVFLKEDGSLNIQTVRLTHDCHCRP